MSQEAREYPVTPQDSATPLISASQREESQQDGIPLIDGAAEEKDPKTGKRRLFGFGRKKEEKASQSNMAAPAVSAAPSNQQRSAELKPQSTPQPIPITPSRHAYPSAVAASPSRLRSSSPRLHSPASSEIFERSVQEPVQIGDLQGELSPAHIPTHVITEDHIPPALEASAEAITSEELKPGEVEIVTSATHLPAAAGLETSASQADLSKMNTPMTPLQQVRSEDSETSMQQSGMLPQNNEEDGASTYGQLDPTDPRRLSFISFADVVQSEHQMPQSALAEPGDRNSVHIASFSSSFKQERSASPLRSPRGAGVTTPPSGINTGMESSPGRNTSVGSPINPHGELTVETMEQAVRKTASGDLSGFRSAGMSPVSDENLAASVPRSRTNS